ncbi:UDP-glycosyltransferase 76B1-like [Magnolia sinica]|uniref:UDP-glycosyltransferase 76B1-like n=1 Tax=Magnolia sinica TaxID=86752 RepID=UPI00265809CA|nr:UDP-glycosyltransferase 76B1-like [Magnolia sinica]
MPRSKERPRQHRKRTHLVLFPCPFQGHITPMLQLATILHSKGFSITIVHTQFNSPNPSNYPNFNFEPISDGLSVDQAQKENVMALVTLLNVNCHGPFSDLMAQMLSEEDPRDPIACIVSDAVMHFTQSVADHFKIPRIILRTSSALSFITFDAFPLLREKGYLPIQDPQSETPVSELPPLRIKDLPNISTDSSETLYQVVAHTNNVTRNSSGIIFNSFEHIEEAALVKIRQDFPMPLFLIGPLHKYSSGSSSSLLPHDHSCMVWLDKQAPGSVIYVSFGSLACMEKKELVEIAWGIANSGQPFLWVVRSGLVRGSASAEMPDGFEEETRGKGLVVKWAPQKEVLAHPSVGGFWTHNGWNSTVESICEGVPMLCWPCFGDQKVNARLVSHVLKVGVQLENGLEREKIGWAIRRLMVEKEGEEMRNNARKLKDKADLCLKKGGSSYESIDRLVNCILSL